MSLVAACRRRQGRQRRLWPRRQRRWTRSRWSTRPAGAARSCTTTPTGVVRAEEGLPSRVGDFHGVLQEGLGAQLCCSSAARSMWGVRRVRAQLPGIQFQNTIQLSGAMGLMSCGRLQAGRRCRAWQWRAPAAARPAARCSAWPRGGWSLSSATAATTGAPKRTHVGNACLSRDALRSANKVLHSGGPSSGVMALLEQTPYVMRLGHSCKCCCCRSLSGPARAKKCPQQFLSCMVRHGGERRGAGAQHTAAQVCILPCLQVGICR